MSGPGPDGRPAILLPDQPPPAQRARREGDESAAGEQPRIVELGQDVVAMLIAYVTDYQRDFEKADTLPRRRLGVSYPRGTPLHGTFQDDFQPDPGKLNLCMVDKITGAHCRLYLITTFLEKEEQHWAAQGHTIQDVLRAIHNRDGVDVVELERVRYANEERTRRRVALVDIATNKQLDPASAAGVLLRARSWYPEYVRCRDGLDERKAFENHHQLHYAAFIVMLAQEIVRLNDHRVRLADFASCAIYVPPTMTNPAAPPGQRWVLDDEGNDMIPDDQVGWRTQALAIIDAYGTPDAWNTSNVTSFSTVFSAKVIGTHERHVLNAQYWRGKPLEDLEREGFPSFDQLAMELAARVGYFLQPEWPVGLYDTSNVTTLEYCFASCSRFNSCVHGWDTSNVWDMTKCFVDCRAFNKPLEQWNVGMCQRFDRTFFNCRAFNQPLDGWSVWTATDMRFMFAGCAAFLDPLNSWLDKLPRDAEPDSRFPVLESNSMFFQATKWMEKVRVQKALPGPAHFFSRLAPYVNTDNPDSGGNNGTLQLPPW